MSSLATIVDKHIREFMAGCDGLMFNERDFQMKLAVSLLAKGTYDDVEVEYYIPNSVAKAAGYEWNSDLRLDLVVRKGADYVPVELKYPTRRVMTDIIRFGKVLPGVEIVKNQGAQDIVMYNFWKDARRIRIAAFIADEINSTILGREVPASPDLLSKTFGFTGYPT